MKKYLAIDQGTTSSRSIIFNSNLKVIKESQKEYPLIYPKDGWVELNPTDVLSSVKETIKNVTDNISISSCGISNQRETTVVWERKTGRPIYNGIVWQDRRTADYCNNLKKSIDEKKIKEKTGLLLDPYFSATKIGWILDNVEGARKKAESGQLLFGTIDTFLIFNLSKENFHYTDVTNASRTLLFNIKKLQWDQDLLKLFNIPEQMLPEVKSCDDFYGTIRTANNEIKINGVIGDQQAALVGQNCLRFGDMKSTYGTGCFLMTNTMKNVIYSEDGLLTTIAYQLSGKTAYALEGSIYSCGNIVNWMKNKLKLFNDINQTEKIINVNGESNNVMFLPAFNGLGTPYWNSEIRAGFYGMTQDTNKNDLINACFKSICFQTKDIIELVKKHNIPVESLKIDGGVSKNKSFNSLLANVLQKTIYYSDNSELTAVGACVVSQIKEGKSVEEIFKDINYSETKEKIEGSQKCNTEYESWKRYIEGAISLT